MNTAILDEGARCTGALHTAPSHAGPVRPIAILGWARTAVVPRHGAFRLHQPHTLTAPLVVHLLQQAGLAARDIDTLLLGNALGAGGNPARLSALAAGLAPDTRCLSIDTQCCAGLDAINLGAALIQSGQADLVIAGGAEAWSRAPIRQHRPLHAGEAPLGFERPACTPWPERDPDPLEAAAWHARELGCSRSTQDHYAQQSHQRAVAARRQQRAEILPLDGIDTDAYPRLLNEALLARMPVSVAAHTGQGINCSLSRLAISPQADGAALVLLASDDACRRLACRPAAWWLDGLQLGGDPVQPMRCALPAARKLLTRHGLQARHLGALELHDAFAVQGLEFAERLGLPTSALNPGGGGIARGHPIGASGAIALVRALATLQAQGPQAEAPNDARQTAGQPERRAHTRQPCPERATPATRPVGASGNAEPGEPAAAKPAPEEAEKREGNHQGQLDASRYGLACIAAVGGLGTATLVSTTHPGTARRPI